MRIAMISEHASPLAHLGGVDAGGQNVHVAELSAALSGAATTWWSTPAATTRRRPIVSIPGTDIRSCMFPPDHLRGYPKTLCCSTCRRSETSSPSTGRPTRPQWRMRILDVWSGHIARDPNASDPNRSNFPRTGPHQAVAPGHR